MERRGQSPRRFFCAWWPPRPGRARRNSKCKTESFTPPPETSREVKRRGRRLGASRLATPIKAEVFPRGARSALARCSVWGASAYCKT